MFFISVRDVLNFCDRRYMEKKFLSKCLIRLSQIQFIVCFHDNVFFRLLATLKTSVTETLLYQQNFFLSPRTIKTVVLQVILSYHRNNLFKSKKPFQSKFL
jgi:hypothetical protein